MSLRLLHLLIALYAFWEAWDGARQLRNGLPKALMFGGLGLIHGIVPCLGPEWYERTPDPLSVHIGSAVYTLVALVLMGLGSRFYQVVISRQTFIPAYELLKSDRFQPRLNALFVICAIGGVLVWLGWVYSSGASLLTLFQARRLELREQRDGLLGALLGNLFYIAYFPGFLAPFLKGKYRLLGIIYPLAFALLLFVSSQGTRGPAIGMLGSLFGGMVFAHRISIQRLVTAGIMFGVIGMLAVAMLPLRHRMHSMTPAEMVAFVFTPETYQNVLTQDPLNYHDHFVGIYAIFPKVEPYVDAASYRRLVFFFLPGERFAELKPKDPNRIVAVALFGKKAVENNMMHPPGVFGDWYINFWGWEGVGLIVLQGAGLAWISHRLASNPWFLIGLGPQVIYLCVIGLRGQPYTVGLASLAMLALSGVLLWLLDLPMMAQRPPGLNRRVLDNGLRPVPVPVRRSLSAA